MSFDKELTHLIEQQISARASGSLGGAAEYARARNSATDSRIEALEANLQRLSEEFMNLVSQKKAQKNAVEYGLEVIALHDFRLVITSGRATFIDLPESIELPFTYLHLSPAGKEREIRYIYLNNTGLILENTTDPSNMGPEYLPLAIIDVWANATEITQSRIKDIRPGLEEDVNTSSGLTSGQNQLVGNVTLKFPDTGNDSFIVAATSPASLKINVSAGRALVDGEIIDAPGGVLDLTGHYAVNQELIGFGDGVKKTFSLYHKNVADVQAFVGGKITAATVETANGQITFATAPAIGVAITASYRFKGDYLLVFLVEKAATEDGKSFGVIGWKAGSNRTPDQPPALSDYQHAIAKVNMSGAITAITDFLIDNSYEVKNLSQYDLQYGGNLGEGSLQDGAITTDKIAANAITGNKVAANTITGNKIAANAITGDKIVANTITGNKIAAGTITGDKIIAGGIDTAHIKAGAITADRVASGAITADKIAANAIEASMIKGGVITADKFESTTWGDLSQAMRFVKTILGGAQAWKKTFTQTDLNIGLKQQVSVSSESYPSLKLDTQNQWDSGTWNIGNWDFPVYSSGYWESASIDYGSISNLQTEFWAKPIIEDPAVTIIVKAKYSNDNVSFTDYEVLLKQSAIGHYYWVGTLRSFRFFKIRVEFTTTDKNKYTLLGFPEARVGNCQIGTEDISNYAVTAEKIASGALVNNIAILSGTIGHGGTIPLPAGYNQNQCRWTVSFSQIHFAGTVDANDSEYCYSDANRLVYVYGTEQRKEYTANYMIIGVK